jgi:hypothetical protein
MTVESKPRFSEAELLVAIKELAILMRNYLKAEVFGIKLFLNTHTERVTL